jgi:uncharacterized Zn-binding protein involved in type VI secretion
MHTCPMQTPGVPPIPHVGGPIIGPGVPNVLIGKMPAAVLGDMATCVGPPDSIVKGSSGVMIAGRPAARVGDTTAHGGQIVLGCMNVIIGESMPGAPPMVFVPPLFPAAAAPSQAAQQGAQSAQPSESPAAKARTSEKGKPLHFVEFQLLGEDGKGVPLQRYVVTLPDGTVKEGVTGLNGQIRYEGLESSGTCKITFPDLDQDAWEEG